MKELEQQALKMRKALRLAVAKALDTKRRLGHYAVMYKNGKVVHVPPEQLPKLEN